MTAILGMFSKLGIKHQSHVFLNWYRFDNIDEIEVDGLNTYFADIWYPSTDDIDLFDNTFKWIVSIRHDGQISRGRLE